MNPHHEIDAEYFAVAAGTILAIVLTLTCLIGGVVAWAVLW